jgi:Ca2+-binding RTX toxin-like protein
MSLRNSHSRIRNRKARQRLARRSNLTIESLEARQLMAYDTVVMADNPIAYYRFEEASGTTTQDLATGNGAQNGTIVGNVSRVASATPALGQALSFDGSSTRVRITDSPVFDLGTGAATIEFWFQTNQAGRGDFFTYKGGGGDLGVHWQSNGAARLSLYHNGFKVETTNNTTDATTNDIAKNEWHHVVITRSGTGVNQTVLYVDGRAVSKGQDDQTWNIANDLLLGSNHSGDPTNAATFFQGQMDEVAFYNTALTEAQVQKHYDAGLGSYAGAIMENKPGVYYNFTNGATDVSGNARDGLVNGAVSFGAAGNSGLGTAANFTGGYISGPSATTLGMTNGSWTATAWVYPRSNGGDKTIFGNDATGTDVGLHLMLRDGKILMGFYGDDLQTNAAPPLNQWSQIVWRYDANTNAQSVFLNGVNVGLRIAAGDYSGSGLVNVGRAFGDNGRVFDGLIDEAAIYPTALSPAEIGALYRVSQQTHANPDTGATTENAVLNGSVTANDAGPTMPFTTSTTSAQGAAVTIAPNGNFTYNPGTALDSLAQGQQVNDTFTYFLNNFSTDNASGSPFALASYGPGGTLNAYIYDPTGRNWDEARARASTMSLFGVSGHLVTVESQAEENFIRQNFPGNFWIGLSDSTGYSLLDGVKNSMADSGNAPASPGFAWSNAAPYTYNAWVGSGEPNGGTGENSAQLRGDALWNDLPSGSTIPGQNDNSQTALIEFNLGELGVNALPAVQGLLMREVRSTVNQNNTQAEANALLAGANKLDETYRIYPFINIVGGGSDGGYGGGMSFPVAGDQSNFADETTGAVYIPAAGNWTFNVNSDDGFELTFPGANATLGTITNGQGSTAGLNGALRFEGGRGNADTLGVFNFPAAGFYNIRLVHYEAGGGDAVELTARQGSFTGWDTNFKLVGDTLNGGLLTYTKMPTAGQSATVTVTVTGVNDAPVAGTVAAQTISEGSPVTFTMVGASDVDAGTTLSYQWDLDNNGSFETTTATNSVTLTQAQLLNLGIDGPYAGSIKARVSDGITTSAAVTANLTVNNVAPTGSISGPANAAPGNSVTFDFSATDPSNDPTASRPAPGKVSDTVAGFTFTINWGDGSANTVVNGVTSGSANHIYTKAGNFTVTLTVKDRDNGSSSTTADIKISPVYIDDDGNLIINGTNAADRIVLSSGPNGLQARINNVLQPAMSPEGGTVKIFGYGGNDNITVQGNVAESVEIYGGDGNDYIAGGSQSDLLDGGNGNDRILGGGGDDTILGGDGSDTLNGGNGNDVLMGDAYVDEFGDIQEGDVGGNDTLSGDIGDDTVDGGVGNDKVNGGAGNDFLYGQDGNDRMDGGAGDDLMMGNDGSDTLYGQAGIDVLIGGNSSDILYGGAGDDLMLGDDMDPLDAMDLYVAWAQNAQTPADLLGTFSVTADDSPDNLYGQGGSDWFLAFLNDRVRDFNATSDTLDRDPV